MNSESQAFAAAMNPRSIVKALWKRKPLIAAVFVAGTGITVEVVTHLTPRYKAEAVILVESQKIPENFVPPTIQGALEPRLDRLKQQVLSGERLWPLIEEFNLYERPNRPRSREEREQMMRKDISITLDHGWSANRPAAFRVAYEGFNPAVTAEIVNRIGGFFIEENIRERAQEADGTSEFLDNQLAESKRNLQEQESKLSSFKVAHTGELPQQEGALLASMAQARTELTGVQDALARGEQNRLILQNSLEAAQGNLKRLQDTTRRRASEAALAAQAGQTALAAPAVRSESALPAAPRGPSELERAREQLRALRRRYEEKYPEVERAREEVERLENEARLHPGAGALNQPAPPVQEAKTAPAAPAKLVPVELDANATADNLVEVERIQTLQAQIAQSKNETANLEARRTRLLQEAADFQARLQTLPIREQELTAITRDYESSKANYRSLLDKKMAADVAANMERRQKAEKLVMLDQARIPEKPAHAKQIPFGIGGSLGSLLLGGAIAFLLELRKHAFLGEWELPSGTTVLGRVPNLEIQTL
jgi:polysaccharide biosynthesis transport protein